MVCLNPSEVWLANGISSCYKCSLTVSYSSECTNIPHWMMPQLLYTAAAPEFYLSYICVLRIHSPVCTQSHLPTVRTLLTITGESIWMHRNYSVRHQSQAVSVWRDSIPRTAPTSSFPVWDCMLTSSLGIKSLGIKVTFCGWHHWHFLNRLKSENIIPVY